MKIIPAVIAAILVAGCASTPLAPPGAAEARSRLTALQSDPQLANRASAAAKDADLAVREAEQPQSNPDIAKYRVYMADRKVDIAIALAKTSLAEDQRKTLAEQSNRARLDARTREADRSANQLATAKVVIAEQSAQADANRTAIDAANTSAAAAQQQAADLQRQIADLNAKQTDRGLVLALGDTLFTSGRSDLKVGATVNLDKLVRFLSHYSDRTVLIEGHTDSLGSDDYNQELSQRRADAVKVYLIDQGINAQRLTSAGRGKRDPVADNGSADGRQQNRRVDVIIANAPTAAR
jgi:outer membrane protein OmpA-like peptidoglycan-associated protein